MSRTIQGDGRRRRQGGWDNANRRTQRARYTDIRFSNALMEPFDVPHDQMIHLCEAIQAFGVLLRIPELESEFKMAPGDRQVSDNRRVLPARAEFDPGSGPRRLQGCCVDRDDFMSRLLVLERQGADFRNPPKRGRRWT